MKIIETRQEKIVSEKDYRAWENEPCSAAYNAYSATGTLLIEDAALCMSGGVWELRSWTETISLGFSNAYTENEVRKALLE